LKGKGVLHHYGANYACDPVITRVDPYGTRRTQVLVCATNTNPDTWCLPGGTVQEVDVKLPPQRQLPEFLMSVLLFNVQIQKAQKSREEIQNILQNCGRQFLDCISMLQAALESSDALDSEKLQAEWIPRFSSMLVEACELKYKGYCDDPRNTDHAWMETCVYHTHLPDFVGAFLDISEEVSCWEPSHSILQFRFRWIDVDSGLPTYKNLYASHFDFVELCVPICKCGRRQYDRNDSSHSPEARVEQTAAPHSASATSPQRLVSQQTRSLYDGSEIGSLSRQPSVLYSTWVPAVRSGASCGEIQFMGKGSPSHYIRARMDSSDDALLVRTALDAMGLATPDALIAVTGGAQDFAMDAETTELVFSGILRAALTTRACITDGGTDAGVMKLLGEAVDRNGHRVSLVGVAGWGIVIGRDCMVRGLDGPARAFYSKTHPNWAGGAGLDPNHHFFLLVDDGTAGEFGTEIEARAKLEDVLRDPMCFQDYKRVVSEARSLVNNPKAVEERLRTWTAGELIKFHKYLPDIGEPMIAKIAEGALREVLDLPDSAKDSNGKRFVPIKEKANVRQYLQECFCPGEALTSQVEEQASAALGKPCVNFCFRCKGSYRDNITLKNIRNSVSSSEYNNWFLVRTELLSRSEKAHVDCNNCTARLSREDVIKEVFYPCKGDGCDHYFFRSRVLDLRQKGRDRIFCDYCHGRTKLDDILGKFVPGVLVVVQGGVGTIRTVASTNAMRIQDNDFEEGDHDDVESPRWDALQQSKESCTPVVIVEGSGKAADFIASTWRHMHEGDRLCYGCPRSSCIAFIRRFRSGGKKHTRLLASTCPIVLTEHRRIFGDSIGESDRKKQVSWVIEACRRKETVTLYNPSRSNEGLDFAIMRAICKGTLRDGRPLSMIEQFQLTIDWSLAGKEVRSNHNIAAVLGHEAHFSYPSHF
jgi:hypothetical protein